MSTLEPVADSSPDKLAFLPSDPPLVSDATIALRREILHDRRNSSDSTGWRDRVFEMIRKIAESNVLRNTYDLTHPMNAAVIGARPKFSINPLDPSDVDDGVDAVVSEIAANKMPVEDFPSTPGAAAENSNVHYVKQRVEITGFEQTSLNSMLGMHRGSRRDS